MTVGGPAAAVSGRTVLLTGATGYIASHTWLALLAAGHEVIGIDNFANSSPSILPRLAALAGRPVDFERIDVTDGPAVEALFARRRIDAVIHFAAHKAVGESVTQPIDYHANNVGGLLRLLQAMRDHGCGTLVFSSSATVYGAPEHLPIREDARLDVTSPYGRTKLISEQILGDVAAALPSWSIARLRYFNPVGAHASGDIGEAPGGVPNNLMPYITQVAVGKRAELKIFGGDYDTPDGTGVRDYIHVVDLADGHVAALERLFAAPGLVTVNLGTGCGYSVLELVRAFEAASGVRIPHRIVARRPGDIASCYADAGAAAEQLGWSARRGIDAMCEDSWRWQRQNPDGYGGASPAGHPHQDTETHAGELAVPPHRISPTP